MSLHLWEVNTLENDEREYPEVSTSLRHSRNRTHVLRKEVFGGVHIELLKDQQREVPSPREPGRSAQNRMCEKLWTLPGDAINAVLAASRPQLLTPKTPVSPQRA